MNPKPSWEASGFESQASQFRSNEAEQLNLAEQLPVLNDWIIIDNIIGILIDMICCRAGTDLTTP